MLRVRVEVRFTEGLRETLLSKHPMALLVQKARVEGRLFVDLTERQLPEGLRGGLPSKHPVERFMLRVFYNHYVLNQREDSTDAHLVGGRVLHCLLFEPDKYDEYFLSLPGKSPTDNQKKIIDNIFKYHLTVGNNTLTLSDYSQDILTQLLTANLYQNLKTDQQRLDKALTEENKSYFDFLKQSLDKTVVDASTLNGCKESVIELKTNQAVRAILQLDKTPDDVHIKTFSENMISIDQEHLPFGYKGILDNVVLHLPVSISEFDVGAGYSGDQS